MRYWLRRLAITLATFLVALTVGSLVYNAATFGRDVAAAKLYPGPWTEVDGTRLAYSHWGTHGTSIVLLGGFIEPSWVWHDVGPILGRTHRVYAVDLPPFGYSQRRGPYTLARWTRLVEGFDRQLGLRKPIVVGHSLGAAVAVSVATESPRSVRGIVLLDGDALPVGGGAAWLSHLLVPPWFTSLYRITTNWKWIFRRGLQSAWGSPHFPATFIAEFQRPFRVSGTASAFTSMLSHGIQGVSAATIASVPVPAVVAWGSRDTVDSVSAGRHTAALMHARFVEIPNAGHLSMLAQPKAVARVIETIP